MEVIEAGGLLHVYRDVFSIAVSDSALSNEISQEIT